MADDKKTVIAKLLERGKKKGILSYQEITDTLEELDLDPKSIDKVYEDIEQNHCKVFSIVLVMT